MHVDPQVRGSRPLGHPNSLSALRVIARVVPERVEGDGECRAARLFVGALVAGPGRAGEPRIGVLDAAAAEFDELIGGRDDAAVAEPVDGAALGALELRGRPQCQHAGHCASMIDRASRDNDGLMPSNPGRPRSTRSSSPRPGGSRPRRTAPRTTGDTSWDRVATWYDGWVGDQGSRYHQALAVPAAMDLLQLEPGESVLEIGSGQGVLAPKVAAVGGHYTGVDASPKLIDSAKRRHGRSGEFVVGDARRLPASGLRPASFDAAVFLLSIQDMDPLEQVLASASWAVREHGRVVIVMTHPAFRQPRHAGWGFDEGRKLVYRRIDAYLTPMAVPMKALGDHAPTRSFHRPISAYVNGLAADGFVTDAMIEIPDTLDERRPASGRAGNRAAEEIPLFLALRGIR
jgi:ubiquinone/menaquinone biosynthesis C-methylase UbiE